MKGKLRWLMVLLSLSLLPNSLTAGEIKMSYKKPYVTADVTTYECLYDIRINDGFVQTDRSLWGDTSGIPVNEWLQPGENELSLHIKPFDAPFYDSYYGKKEEENTRRLEEAKACNVMVTLKVHESGNMSNRESLLTVSYQHDYKGLQPELSIERTELSNSSASGRYVYSKTESVMPAEGQSDLIVGDIEISRTDKGGVLIKRRFSMDLPFPRWRYLDADLIENTPEIKRSLYDEYVKLEQMLNSGKFDQLSRLFSERKEEMNIAYYSDGSKETDMGKVFARVMNNPNLKLYPTKPEEYEEILGYSKLVIYGHRKLAKITTWDDDDFIGFNYTDGGGSSTYGVTFARKNGKWYIAR